MRFPRGKGFDLACGVVITVFLDDIVSLTGSFLGTAHGPHQHGDLHEFILIQLTCPFRSRGGTRIPAGTFCAINVEQILFIVPGKKSHHDKCHDGKNDDGCHDDKDHDGKDHDDCHDMLDDKGCDFDIWEDECDDKHVINIKYNRTESKQRVININCDDDNTAAKEIAEDDAPS